MLTIAPTPRPTTSCVPRVTSAPPQAASEPVDFSSIDTPEKAVLMPILNPAILSATLAGIFLSTMTNGPVSAALSLAFNDTRGELQYTCTGEGASATGQIGGLEYRESWTLDREKRQMLVEASLGETRMQMTITPGSQNAAQARGQIGDLKLIQVIGGKSDMSSVSANGRLGGQTLGVNLAAREEERDTYLLSVNGAVGQAPLSQEIKLSQAGEGFAIEASGAMAGTDFRLSGSLNPSQAGFPTTR